MFTGSQTPYLAVSITTFMESQVKLHNTILKATIFTESQTQYLKLHRSWSQRLYILKKLDLQIYILKFNLQSYYHYSCYIVLPSISRSKYIYVSMNIITF
jgi:hypothetical protein